MAPTATAKEKYAPNEDADNPLYRTDSFRMYCLKVLPCSKRFCHDWTTCPFAHAAEKAKRRDPRVYNYTGVACPEMKKNQTCPRGDQCPYAHNVFEYWLHHSRYRTQLCNDGAGCKRKICFFAHTLDELRVSSVKVQVPEGVRESSNGCINPFAPSPKANKQSQAQTPQTGHRGGMDVQQDPFQQDPFGLASEASHEGAAGLQDQAALEQLMRILAAQQQQQQQVASGPDALQVQQLMAAQMLLAQQQQAQVQAQQQAAAVLQAQQQQMAALQLLQQMNMEQYGGGYGAGGLPPPAVLQAALQQQQQQQQAMAAMASLAAMRPPAPMISALTAALGSGAAPEDHAGHHVHAGGQMEELARQLSGLSTSSHMDVPSSARSYGSSAYTPKRGSGNSNGRPSRPSHDAGAAPEHAMMTSGGGMPMKHAGPGHMMMGSYPPAAAAGAAGGQHGPAGLRGGPLLQASTAPINIAPLEYAAAGSVDPNSYFSISHSLASHESSEEAV